MTIIVYRLWKTTTNKMAPILPFNAQISFAFAQIIEIKNHDILLMI